MELDPFCFMPPMSQSHDLSFFRPCAYFETFGHRFSIEEEGVIPDRLKGIGQPAVNRLSIMIDGGGLAVSDPFGSDDLAAKGVSDGLMS
jgi:hypothetical protein